ncbi:MAG: translocation/assembly module TamB [Bacteroidales bacterium]|jgi:hypothetical protein|nr:translocation/assembly module TamB [Bacteroidales bacterium]
MAKNIKKSFKYIIIFFGILISVPTLLSFFLRIPVIQTFMVRRVTDHISAEIRSTISVGKVEFKFFNKLSLNDIIIKDQNDDTLLFSQRLSVGIKHIDLKNKSFTLGRIIAENPVLALITDSSGVMNLTWYLDMMKKSNDTLKKSNSTIRINQIDIKNARFSLVNKLGEKSKRGIDFNNLHLSGINGTLEDLINENNTTSFSIYRLGFMESGGFNVTGMNSEFTLTKNDILFTSTSLNCDSSILNIPYARIHADSLESYKNFTQEVRIDVRFRRSQLSFSDLQYFVPALKEMHETIWLSGRIHGSVSELRGRNIEIVYRDQTLLNCDFDFSGLPIIENTFMYLGVNILKTNATDLEKIRIPGRGKIILPDFFYKLGTISFNGNFTGFTTDFVTYGKLNTSLGSVSTDIFLRPEESNRYQIKGLITGSSIALGQITGNPEMFGNISLRTDVDGYAYSLEKFSGNLRGLIDSIEINNYKYRNISLNGIFSEKTWDGNVKISEENIKMDLLGMFKFSGKLPEFDFTLNLARADLHDLNLDKIDSTAALSMLLTAKFIGNNIDNLDGEIKLVNMNLKKYENTLELNDFSIRTFSENDQPAINLRTDFVDADLRGYYNFAGLGTLFKSTLSAMMPSLFTSPASRNEPIKNNFAFNIDFKNTDRINNFFRTGILLADNTSLKGSISSDSSMSISGISKSLNIKNNIFNDLIIEANLNSPELSVKLNSSSLSLSGQSELKGFSVELNTKPDNFIFNLNWDNREQILNTGNFVARGTLEKNIIEKAKPLLRIEIDSTIIYNRNNPWKINHSYLILDSNSVNVNRLFIGNKERYYLIDGTVSENPADTLLLQFKGIDISPVNYLIERKKSADMVPLSIKGELNGNVFLTGIYKNLLLESNLSIINFSMLESEYGDLTVVSAWNSEKKVADIHAGNNLNGRKMIDIRGYYDPLSKKINLTAVADKFPVDALNPLLKIFASGITGTASGKVNISGETDKMVLKGALMAENTSMKIDYLQAKYMMNDSVRFNRNNILFNDVKLTDEKGNSATLDGSIFHKYFKEYGADLMINMNECMVLNTKQKDNELFYGTAYASGVTTIKSGPTSIAFDISGKTGNNTRFYIPLNTSETVSDYSFISFVSHDTSTTEKITGKLVPSAPASANMDLNIDLEITPDAEVQLIFDSSIGDVMKGRGSGNLNINLNRKGDFRISGDYIIEDGDYLFTLGNIFNKEFSVENGGKIIFNGDIDNAEIDIKAIYKLKASLYEILHDERFNERIPVECQINLSGKLFNPVVGFNIYLPLADEETRTYLRNVITTEEELSRQFLYLLVMNSFYADPSYGTSLPATNITGTSATTTGTSAMAVTTTEMLSNQLSNWLSQISNDFDIGFVYRPGYKDINSQEVQVALSTQLLNDKVVINSNFDMRGPGGTSGNTDQITGDFDVEYKITDKIRFKVFNRFNNPYSGKEGYTQGFGFFFRQDFDKFSDLFIKKVQSGMKKEEEPALLN